MLLDRSGYFQRHEGHQANHVANFFKKAQCDHIIDSGNLYDRRYQRSANAVDK